MDSYRVAYTHPLDSIVPINACNSGYISSPTNEFRPIINSFRNCCSHLPCPQFLQKNVNIIWCSTMYILSFPVILCIVYSIFHFGLDSDKKRIIMNMLTFADEWKQFLFFLCIYIGYAIKKVFDVRSVSFSCRFEAFAL